MSRSCVIKLVARLVAHAINVRACSQCFPIQASDYRPQVDHILLRVVVKLWALLGGIDLNDLVLS